MSGKTAERIHALVLRHADALSQPAGPFASRPCWAAVRRSGSLLWLDTGDVDEADELWSSEFSALTTNNTSLNAEAQKGIYDRLVSEAAAALPDSTDRREAVMEAAFVLNAVHGLRLARRFQARVSVELHTAVAHDIENALRYARRLHAVCPDRFLIKVPLTVEGFLIARRLHDEGIPVNFTAGFSARQNYFAAVFARPAYVNVFVQRITLFVSENGLGVGLTAAVRASLASQRAVREANHVMGLRVRQIMASMRLIELIEALAGCDVLTLNPAVVREFAALPPAPAPLPSRVEDQPAPDVRAGVDLAKTGLNALWDVPASFKAEALVLARKDPESMTPDALRESFAKAGFPDFLPGWSPADTAKAKADGKVPVYDFWKDRLASCQIGLDALMTLSVLMAFETDQDAMDQRIARLIA